MSKAERESSYGKDLLDKTIAAVYRLHEIRDVQPPAPAISKFPARVRLSSFFCHKWAPGTRKTNREGYAIGESKDKCSYLVIWDGTISRQAYHKDFIELIEQEQTA